MSAPLFARDPLTASRYEVRLAGGACPGLRTDSLALATAVAGALLALGRAAEVRDRSTTGEPAQVGGGVSGGAV
jgi:hypothetical protein